MAAKTIRRRFPDGYSDERNNEHMGTSVSDTSERNNEHMGTSVSDILTEPLLREYDPVANQYEECDDKTEDGKKTIDKQGEPLCWTHLFSNWVTKCAYWIKNIVIASQALLRKMFSHLSISRDEHDDDKVPLVLNSLQEERLSNLRHRLEIPFDISCLDHQEALKQLWGLAYPQREIPPLKSELWKEMGWQGSDPSTDFRSGGFLSLENLIFFAKNYPESFQRLLHKKDGKRSEWEYPFAAAGVNVSFMLTQMLGLRSGTPISGAAARFVECLGADEMAFDTLYCVAFQMLDSRWLSLRASYMEFNEVLRSTRTQLEHELGLDNISRIEDLPSYRMLNG